MVAESLLHVLLNLQSCLVCYLQCPKKLACWGQYYVFMKVLVSVLQSYVWQHWTLYSWGSIIPLWDPTVAMGLINCDLVNLSCSTCSLSGSERCRWLFQMREKEKAGKMLFQQTYLKGSAALQCLWTILLVIFQAWLEVWFKEHVNNKLKNTCLTDVAILVLQPESMLFYPALGLKCMSHVLF